MENSNKIAAVILAAGAGNRMFSPITKQKLNICGASVLKRCVAAFNSADIVSSIVVVCRDDEIDFATSELAEFDSKPIKIVTGGQTRQMSAKIGFLSVCDECDFVAIHDGARCLVTPKMINDVCSAAILFGCATASAAVTDTVKCIDGGFTVSSVKRENLCFAQTPQVFSCDLYKRALAASDDVNSTDDNTLVEALGVRVKLVDTGKENIKITSAEDISYAEYIISKRGECCG